jgi:hypothetical protein
VHWNYWCYYEQVHFGLQAVRLSTLCFRCISLYRRLSLSRVAEGGSIAEEVISTVRTAQAFGTQKVLSGIYDERINESLRIDLRIAAVHGSAMSVFFFVIYAGYALGMLTDSPDVG